MHDDFALAHMLSLASLLVVKFFGQNLIQVFLLNSLPTFLFPRLLDFLLGIDQLGTICHLMKLLKLISEFVLDFLENFNRIFSCIIDFCEVLPLVYHALLQIVKQFLLIK
jgi:hypothetical protein